MAAGVGQLEPAAQVLDADARADTVGLGLRVAAVLDPEGDPPLFPGEADADERGAPVVDAMLEGVLDGRDEEQRNDRHVGHRVGQVDLDPGHLVAAQAHQVDVVAHEGHLAGQRHLLLARLIEGVAQQVAQLADALLGRVGIHLDEAADVVERIEEEVGVQLVPEPDQLRLGVLLRLRLALQLHLVPAGDVAHAGGEGDDEELEEDRGADDGPEDRLPLGGVVWGEVPPKGDSRYQGQVDGGVFPEAPPLEEAAGDDQVEVEEIEEDEWNVDVEVEAHDRQCLLPVAFQQEGEHRRQDAEHDPEQDLGDLDRLVATFECIHEDKYSGCG